MKRAQHWDRAWGAAARRDFRLAVQELDKLTELGLENVEQILLRALSNYYLKDFQDAVENTHIAERQLTAKPTERSAADTQYLLEFSLHLREAAKWHLDTGNGSSPSAPTVNLNLVSKRLKRLLPFDEHPDWPSDEK